MSNQKDVDPFEAGVVTDSDSDSDTNNEAGTKYAYTYTDGEDQPGQVSTGVVSGVDLPAIHTTTSGKSTEYIWVTSMPCPSCRGASKGSRIGIVKILGGNSLTGECLAQDCRATVHLLVQQLPASDQQRYNKDFRR